MSQNPLNYNLIFKESKNLIWMLILRKEIIWLFQVLTKFLQQLHPLLNHSYHNNQFSLHDILREIHSIVL